MRSTPRQRSPRGSALRVEQPLERHVGVGVAGHDAGRGTRRRSPAPRRRPAPSRTRIARHLGLAADLDAEVAGGRGQRLRQPAHAAAHVAPHAALAVGLAHDVVEQHVGVPGIDGAAIAPMMASVASVALSSLRLEPAVEDRPRRPGQDLDRLAGAVARAAGTTRPSASSVPQVARGRAAADRAASSSASARRRRRRAPASPRTADSARRRAR